MEVFFEDSQALEYSLSRKHLFYCFYNSTMHNDLPILPHWHYYIEILLVTIGTGKIILNGNTYILNKGDMVYILPQDVHSIEPLLRETTTNAQPSDNKYMDFEYAVIKFDPVILFESSYDALLIKNIIPVISPIPPDLKVFLAKDVTDDTQENIRFTMSTFKEKPYGYAFLIKSQLMLFYYNFLIHLKEKGYKLLDQNFENNDLSAIVPAFKYIHENFTSPITAEDVAGHCHLSYSYFSRLFKKVSGITFTKYLNFTRITEAERLLLNHEKSITDISFAVGFSDTSYFIKQFKSFKQITPKQFVKLTKQDQ